LVADIFGFWCDDTAHHSGGMSVYNYCYKHRINPKLLYIGWLEGCRCVRCTENALYDRYQPLLNRNRPPKCKVHALHK
jgi:hypothetical protein